MAHDARVRPARARIELVAVVVVLVAVVALALVWWRSGPEEGRARVVDEDAGREGWQTLEYDGVRLDVPGAWTRVDTSGCPFTFERWGPPGTGCDDVGVAFPPSATFDAGVPPGRITRTDDPAGWAGYARNDRVVVSVSGPDRDVVRDVLASVDRGVEQIR